MENKIVGRNMYITRKIRDKKAVEVAEFLDISESAYTKYERGESKITIEMVQKLAEFHKIDPLQLLMSQPGHIVDNGNNSNIAIQGTVNTTDEKQTSMMMKLLEAQLAMTEKIIALLEKK